MDDHQNCCVDAHRCDTTICGFQRQKIVQVVFKLTVTLAVMLTCLFCCGCSAWKGNPDATERGEDTTAIVSEANEPRLLMDVDKVIYDTTELPTEDMEPRFRVIFTPRHSAGMVYAEVELFEAFSRCKYVAASRVPYNPVLYVLFEPGEDNISAITGIEESCVPTEEEREKTFVFREHCDVGNYTIHTYAWPSDVDIDSDLPVNQQGVELSRLRSISTKSRLEEGFFSRVVDVKWHGLSRTNYEAGHLLPAGTEEVLGAVVVPIDSDGISSVVRLAPMVGEERIRELVELSVNVSDADLLSERSYRVRIDMSDDLADEFSVGGSRDLSTDLASESTQDFIGWFRGFIEQHCK